MKQIQKILFPIDVTEKIESFLPWVATFADKFGATVYALFVTQDMSAYSALHVPHATIDNLKQESMKAAEQKMKGIAQEFFKGFARLETRVMAGKPAEKILELARQEGIDLIIMGAHGRKGLERALFGSVADKVVQGAPCPVLTIHP